MSLSGILGAAPWSCLWVIPYLGLSIGCSPNHSITPEPTAEEPARLASAIAMADPPRANQLIRGFHRLEEGSWRWTEAKFAASLGTPPGASRSGAWLVLKFSLPPILLQHFKTVTLSSELDHTPLAPETYDASGPHEYRRDVPAPLLKHDAAQVEFSLDHFLAAGTVEARELGLIVTSVALEPK